MGDLYHKKLIYPMNEVQHVVDQSRLDEWEMAPLTGYIDVMQVSRMYQ